MDRDLNVAELWSEALQRVAGGEVTKPGVNEVDLRELETIGDEAEFWTAALRQDLLSLGFLRAAAPTDVKHMKPLDDLLQVIYRHAAAVPNDLVPSHFITTFTWIACSQLLKLQLSCECPSPANRIKGLILRVLGVEHHSRKKPSLYTSDSKVKQSILALFTDIITLSTVAKTNACQRRHWLNLKRYFRASASGILDPYILKLHDSIGELASALVTAAARSTSQPYDHDDEPTCQSQLSKKSHGSGHCYPPTQVFGDARVQFGDNIIDKMVVDRGEPKPSLPSWLQSDSIQEDQLSSPVPGTCIWLLQTSEWLSWSRMLSSSLLVIAGPQGSGKSTLAQFACRELKKAYSLPVLFYSFGTGVGPASHGAQTFLISILAQLYHSSVPSRRNVSRILERHRPSYTQSIRECSYSTLLRLVKRVLDKIPSFYLVVDSLDVNMQEKESLHDFLMELGSRKGAAVAITCQTVTSSTLSAHKTLKLQSCTKQLQYDIRCFVKYQVNTIRHLQGSRAWILKREIINKVALSATFLHAKLMIEVLRKLKTPGEIRDTMDDLGKRNSKDLYEKLLRDSEERLSGSPKKLARQRIMLRLMVAAQEALSLEQIAEFLAINQDTGNFSEDDFSLDIAQEIEELCGSFVSVSESDRVNFFHPTAKTFFESHRSTTAATSNLYLAVKCLTVLSQDKYADIEEATKLLRHHFPNSSESLQGPADPSSNSSIYKYAALYFHQHITLVKDPPQELISELGRFLQGIEFVTWSERVIDLKPGTGYAAQVDVRASLSMWIQRLPPADQATLKFDRYFEAPFMRVSEILKKTAKNKVLQFLPRIRFGDFLNEAGQSTGDWQKAYEQKQIVYHGLLKVPLSPKDPFLLSARAKLLQEFFWQKRFVEALPELQNLYALQKEVTGNSGDEIFVTAWMIGGVWIALCDYKEAETVLSKTLEQVRQLKGKKDRFFNMLLLLEGQRLERVGDLDKAEANYSAALITMTEIAGDQNAFVLMLKTAIGGILRKQGQYAKAEELLLEGWAGRQKVSSINVNVCFDEAMQLATFYRDKGDAAECMQLLDAIEDSTVRLDDFERDCQFIHIHSLVAFDRGEYNEPKYALMKLINSASGKDRAKNNRELLWIRIDLADAMRLHDEPNGALMLFSELVVAANPTDTSELYEEGEGIVQLEDPVQLDTAEKALRLFRNAEYAESERVLQEKGLRWFRDADFHFSIQGGPTLDTSIIRSIRVPCMESI